MTGVETRIRALLIADTDVSALVSTRVWPVQARQAAQLPFLVVHRVSGGKVNSLSGYSGLEYPRVQIDCYASTFDGTRTLASKVRVAMDGATTFSALCDDDVTTWEEASGIWRTILDFTCGNEEGTT